MQAGDRTDRARHPVRAVAVNRVAARLRTSLIRVCQPRLVARNRASTLGSMHRLLRGPRRLWPHPEYESIPIIDIALAKEIARQGRASSGSFHFFAAEPFFFSMTVPHRDDVTGLAPRRRHHDHPSSAASEILRQAARSNFTLNHDRSFPFAPDNRSHCLSQPRTFAQFWIFIGCTFQGAMHDLRLTRNDGEVGARSGVRLEAPLFPIAQRAHRNMIAGGELLLRQTERTPQRFRSRLRRMLASRSGVSVGALGSAKARHEFPRMSAHRLPPIMFDFLHDISAVQTAPPAAPNDPGVFPPHCASNEQLICGPLTGPQILV
jgi:hypothetical protein